MNNPSPRRAVNFLFAFAVITGVAGWAHWKPAAASTSRHLVIVIDGLRPDYVTPDVMPRLTALGARGVVFTRHHSVFPTVTRVNASSISTGAYPERHGLMGNTVFFPRVDPAKFLDTSNRSDLLRVAASEGRLLTTDTLGEVLNRAGRRMLVVSSGSTGSAFLNNHTVSGGAILHYEYALPATLERDLAPLGFPLTESTAPDVLDHFAVDAFLKVGLPAVDPAVTVMWLSGLDTTAHDKGVGAPETVAILRKVDAEIGRIEEGLTAAGRHDVYDIWVTSDHGFSTHTGAVDLTTLLRPYAGTLPDGSPRIVTSGGAIYVRDHDRRTIDSIVHDLQRDARVGAVFTRGATPDSLDGVVDGTLSFGAIRWAHDRAADILFSPQWTDSTNAFGMKGTVASGGTAGHGSSSPWDVHNTLMAAGPDLKHGARLDVPSANVDFAPTFLKMLDLPASASFQGRPLDEALANAASTTPAVSSSEHAVHTRDGAYTAKATFTTVTVDGRAYRYFDSASATHGN